MTTIEFLSYLRGLDIRVSRDGGSLRVNAPDGALPPSLRDELSRRKTEILKLLADSANSAVTSDNSIPRVPSGIPLPLSFAQERLWFLDQFEPNSAAYNIPTALLLKGPLNIDALEYSLSEIVRRHEALRTTFETVDGSPLQVIHSAEPISLKVVNLEGMPDSIREEESLRRANEEAMRPFDLAHGPLLRTSLLRLGSDEHVFFFTFHHIVSDAWSRGIFYRELSELYRARIAGRSAALDELQIQYADFASWQRTWLSGDVLARQVNYWKSQLNGAPDFLNLPTDHSRPPTQSFRGARHQTVVAKTVADLARAIGREESATPFMVFLTAFSILLCRYSADEDIVVGTPVANRSQGNTEPLIGFFVNTLAIRVDLSGNPTFRQLLRRVRKTALEAYAHQDLPFEKLIDELSLARDTSRSPLFQAMFIHQEKPASAFALEGLSVSPIHSDRGISKLDLMLSTAEDVDGLYAQVEYATDLFTARTMERLLTNFAVLLQSLMEAPDRSVAEARLLPESEQRQVLRDFNDTRRDFGTRRCIHELFEDQVRRTPEAEAVAFEGNRLTYAEFNARSNRLAHYLMKRGVAPETVVGVFAERSIEMVVALYAILKAGGAYLPLDPEYPSARIESMVQDSRVSIVLTQSHLLAMLPPYNGEVFCVDSEWDRVSDESAENPNSGVNLNHLAYVIYTSGSTGKPKGAMNTHGGIQNRLLWMQEEYGLINQDRILQKTPFSFDVSVWEFFWPLMTGAALVVALPGGHRDGAYLSRLIDSERITTIHFVPSMLQVFLDEPVLDCRSLKRVICSGEALPYELQERCLSRLTSAELHNLYGPTEAAVDVTSWQCSRKSRYSFVPIGKPISNIQIYILDSRLQPVPIGVPGELHIGGVGVARGYLNRPELTSEKFIRDPFDPDSAARMYKTGDLARFHSDGVIEYLGRIDHQVKIRGLRIELGEIEAVLTHHNAVREAVVTVWAEKPDDKRLVAYLVLNAGQMVSSSDLRNHCRGELPVYMVPSAFVILESFPLSANGKVNRRLLPRPEFDTDAREYSEPRNAVEQTLADIWKQFLRVERIGIHDNFFELGGDSILSIRIVSRANQAGLRLTARDVFQYQTIAELAAVARPAVADQTLHQEEVTGEVSLTPIQHWFFEQQLENPQHWNQSMLLAVRDRIDPAILERAFQHVIRHHDALRMRFDQKEGAWIQFNTPISSEVPFGSFDLSRISDDQCEQKIAVEADRLQSSIRLQEPPLIRAVYFDMGDRRPGRLFIVIHHLVVDGVSWRILLEDLQLAYDQLRNGVEVRFAFKSTSFRDWSKRLSEYARTSSAVAQLPYWLAQTAGHQAALPFDAEGRNTEESARNVVVSLDRDTTRSLLQEIPEAYHTQINDVLLAALAPALTHWIGSDDVMINLEGHGREEIIEGTDHSRTVGWFTSLFPFLLISPRGAGIGETLKRVKEDLRRIPTRGVGYGILRYLGGPDIQEQLGAIPQPQTSFNYWGQVDSGHSDGLLKIVPGPRGTAHHPEGTRPHILDVAASVMDGELRVRWTYSENLHLRATIERVAYRYVEELQSLIAHCKSESAGGYTPSDFPLARLDDTALNEMVSLLGGDPRAGTRLTNVQDIYPLSPMQQGMLFHALFEPAGGFYIIQFRRDFVGSLETTALRKAFNYLIEAHPTLRTAFFVRSEGEPLQVVRQSIEIPWEELDWRAFAAEEQQQRLGDWLKSDRRRGFELTRAPLMRATLIRLDDDRWQLIWTHHHLLLDGWSLAQLRHELIYLYDCFSAGNEPVLELRRWFRDYLVWLSGEDLRAAESYWRNVMRGFTAPTPLTVDRFATPVTEEPAFDTEGLLLSLEETDALREFARERHVTLNTIVVGAWMLLLSRYSGEQDIVAGTTVSGRPTSLQGVESIIGPFINTLPLRSTIDGGQTISEWLRTLQERQSEMMRFEHSPLVRIQEWSDLAGHTLFESIFVFENYPVADTVHESKREVRIVPVPSVERSHYPLTVIASARQELLIKINYDCSRFEAASVRRILIHLRTIIVGMVRTPLAVTGSLSILTEEERRLIIFGFNETARDYRTQKCIHQLFEEQVELTPHAEAVVFEQTRLSYAEFNRRANQLAHFLRRRGVGPEVLVGLYAERSVEMVVALYAILKAGGAYVPIDPEYPLNRIQMMLDDSHVPILLTQSHLLSHLPSNGVEVFCLDSDWASLTAESDENPASGVGMDNLAYVIYTSGSTGKPKGAMNTHRGIQNRLLWMQEAYSLTPADHVLQKTPFSFDVSVWEFFWPLISGASLVVAIPGGHRDTAYLAALVEEEQITTLHFVPSMLQLFLEETTLGGNSLKRVICSGEALSYDLQRQFFSIFKCELHNLYGPTEAAVDVTYWQCRPDSPYHFVPIGKPITNTQIYILDRNLDPVPVGVAGELHIGGVGVARGYLNRPELTAEKFIRDPFSSKADARMYKTGDLARFLPDGTIEYLGRIDHQVKISGLRIELGEIEFALTSQSGVKEAVVMAREDEPGDKRLVAYLVTTDSETVTPAYLRNKLREQLPAYMVPGAFVLLDAMPLSPNGKVDRKILPAPEIVAAGREYLEPRSQVERILAEIWSRVLRVEQVGVSDNFFELGGDSILIIQIAAKAGREGLKVSPKQIFEYPTIAQLANVVEIADQTVAEQGVVLGPVPLTPIQRWYFDLNLMGHRQLTQSVVLELNANWGPDLVRSVIAELIRHHDALRLRFHAAPEGWRQEILDVNSEVAWTETDISSLSQREQVEQFDEVTLALRQTLSPTDGPTIHAAYFARGSGNAALLFLVAHHLVVDGVSWRILVEDLTTACDQLSSGRPLALPPKTTSFKEWAEKLQGYARSPNVESELEYWMEESEKSAPDLPVMGNGDDSAQAIDILTTALNEDETTSLVSEVPQVYHTQINEVLLAALLLAVRRWSGQGSIRVSVEGHGREEIVDGVDLSRTVGWFTSLFPITLEIEDWDGPGEALKKVKEYLRKIPNRGIGYGILKYLGRDEVRQRLGHVSSPQMMFNYLGQIESSRPDQDVPPPEGIMAQTPTGGLTHALDVALSISNGRLRVTWKWDKVIFSKETIEQLSSHYLSELLSLITHCKSPEAGGYTPSDFALANLDQDALRRLSEQLTRKND